MASEVYEQKRESKHAVAVWTVKVSFPAYGELPAKTFYWGTSAIEVDDEEFKHKLIDIPSGRHTRDRGNDYASFSASNPNNALYNEFYPYEDLIERAEVEIKECYEIELGFYESEIRFFGYLKDFNLQESEKSMQFNAFSDLSRTGFLVGGRILTRERCGTYFNVNGLESPLDSPCGWQTIQGGNPLSCSKFLTGANGCASHNNTHRFYAITGLADAVIEMITGNSSGFPYETGPTCFVKGTLILMANWTLKPIEEIEVGDAVLAFDIFTDRLQNTTVLKTFEHTTDQFENAEFTNNFNSEYLTKRIVRNFGVTKEHLFCLGNAKFQAYAALKNKPVQGITREGKRREIASIGSETVYGKTTVYNFHTETGTYLISDRDKEIIIKVHNLKQYNLA